MQQLALYDRPGTGPPRARRNDADGSHIAADRLERSGRAAAQLAAVLDAVRAWPGRTSREIAAHTGLDRHMIARRLPELWAHGKVTRIRRAGEELRWRVV